MPTISFFYGIYIMMYVDDHLPPHFHIEYQGQEAQINIRTGEIIKGRASPQTLRIVNEWRQIHIEELLENWENAKKLIMPKKIAPLE